MPLASSDAVIDVLRVGRDGVRFRVAVELHLPMFHREGPPKEALPTRHDIWVQAASPPPTRDGDPWWDGVRVHDGTENGRPFKPTGLGPGQDDGWKRHGVFCLEGIPSLDEPGPGTVVLDQGLTVPFEWGRQIPFRREVDPRGFLSIPYPQPPVGEDGVNDVGVNYFCECTLRWRKRLTPGDWVAISFDRFTPPGRRSADYIAQVERCNLFEPPRQAGHSTYPG